MNRFPASHVGSGMRFMLAAALLLTATDAQANESLDEPARTGLDRFRDHHHELGVVTGSGGPLAGAGSYAVDGLQYHENNGELADAFFGSIIKIIDSHWDKRVDCSTKACNFVEATVFVPHLLGDRAQSGAKGGIVEFGLAVPTEHLVFTVAASIGFVTARVPGDFVGDARDALAFALHLPLAQWLTFSARVDLNLFALYPEHVLQGWRRDSPLTLGLHADLGRRVFANADLVRGDIVKGGVGTTLGLGIRF